MHSRSIEFAKKYDVPLMVRNSRSDALGTWIVPEAEWMSEFPVCGAALAADEARLVLEGVPDRPGISHRVFAALADANIAVDMIGQSVGTGGKATIGFTVLNSDLEKTKKTLAPIASELKATLTESGKVSKVSVVGAGMRALSGVAEQMFRALSADGVNMKMITTGDIKISVLVDKNAATDEPGSDGAGEQIKKAHLESRKSVRGRKALRAVHEAFKLAEPRKGAGVPPDHPGNGFKQRPNPLVVPGTRDREAAIARLEGMEDVLVSGVHQNAEQSRVTIHDLPDKPGNCSRVFNAVATGGILVDMIVQNLTRERPSYRSRFLVRISLRLKRTQDVIRDRRDCASWRRGCRGTLRSWRRYAYTGVARTMFGALAARGINIAMINTSEVCVGVVVENAATSAELSQDAFKLA